MKKNLNKAIKMKSILKGKTIKDMFEGSGITYATFMNVANGKTSPTSTTISSICSILDVDRKQFYELLKNTIPKG